MVRKSSQSGKSPNKKRKNDPDNPQRQLTNQLTFATYQQQDEQQSVHKRNLCIVSFPIIFLFNVLRSLLYQIFVILRFVYFTSSGLLFKKKQLKNIVVVGNNKQRERRTIDCYVDSTNNVIKTGGNEDGCCVVEDLQEMSSNMTSGQRSTSVVGPGPGDPLLAKQKHHHRRAFEYISKALKIDEENEGSSL